MSEATIRADARPGQRMDRLQPWIAALSSVLLHIALLVLMWSSPTIVTTPQGSAAGALQVVDVDYVGDAPPPPATPPPAAAPAATRLQTTPVEQAEATLPREAPDTSDALTVVTLPPREPRPAPPAPVAPPQPSKPRPAHQWGQPPGMLAEDMAPVNAGTAPSPDVRPGRRYNSAADESELDAGGYQVIYDLIAERRLREWRDAGMTEVFFPLPGSRQLMACPLETALRRGSGPCRLIEPDDPDLANIGDAREVLSMDRVYRRGELVWRGPGAYR